MFGFGSVSAVSPSSSIIPTTTDVFNLGSTTKRFNTAHLSNGVAFYSATDGIATLQQSLLTGGVSVCGGSSSGFAAGSSLTVYGITHSTGLGSVLLQGGNVASSHVNIRINHASAVVKFLNSSGQTTWQINNSGQLLQEATTGSDIIFSNTGLLRGVSGSLAVSFCGGSAASSANGSYITLSGVSHANAGSALINGGNAATSHIVMQLGNNSAEFRIMRNGGLRAWYLIGSGGALYQDASNGGYLSFNRPNTTINFAGAMGSSTKNPETDAENGWIEIAVAGVAKYIPYYNAS